MKNLLYRLGGAVLALQMLFVTSMLYGGNRFYASPSGKDSNAGTLNAPWQSIQRSIRNISPGDTLFLRGGNYNEVEILIDGSQGGTSGKYKTVKAYPGEVPSFVDTDIKCAGSYVRFVALEFKLPSSFSSIGDYLEVVKCRFLGTQPRYAAILIASGNYCLISENTIEITNPTGSSTDHGIYIATGKGTVVRRNTVSGTNGYGIQVYDERKNGDPAGYIRRMQDVTVEENVVVGSHERSGIIVSYGPSADVDGITIRKNVVVGNNHIGILIKRGKNIKIYNNTLYNNGVQGIDLGDGDGSELQNVSIVNNIIVQYENQNCSVNCDWYERYGIEVASNATGINIFNNLYWPNDVELQGANDAQGFIFDPKFAAPEQNDFTLSEGSSAIDKGIDIGLPFANTAPDLGAFEFNGVSSSVNGKGEAHPVNFVLYQNHPNPFNAGTKIGFELRASAVVKLTIYDIEGRLVKKLIDSTMSTGVHEILWDGTDDRRTSVASGLYYYKLETSANRGAFTSEMKKMLLLR